MSHLKFFDATCLLEYLPFYLSAHSSFIYKTLLTENLTDNFSFFLLKSHSYETFRSFFTDSFLGNLCTCALFALLSLSVRLTIFIIKFLYKAHSDWLKQRALSENKARVDDGKLAFEFLIRNFDKFEPI